MTAISTERHIVREMRAMAIERVEAAMRAVQRLSDTLGEYDTERYSFETTAFTAARGHTDAAWRNLDFARQRLHETTY